MNLLRFLNALCFMLMTNLRGARVVLSLYALHLGASPFVVGMLAAAGSFMAVLLAWPVGRWADRAGARWPMLAGAFAGATSIVLPVFLPGIPMLFVAALCNGAGFVAFNVAQQNAVGMLSSPQSRAQNFSNLTLMISMAGFAGPLLAGFSIDHGGYALACIVVALCSAIPAVLLLLYGGRLPAGSASAGKGGGNVMEVLRDRALLKVLMIGSLVLAAVDLFQFYLPVYAHGLAMPASTIGVILASYAAASFIVRVFLSKFLERATVEQVLARCFALSGLALVFVPFVDSAVLLCMLAFVFGFGVSVGQPITMMLAYSNSAEGRSGEVMGVRQSVHNFIQVISPTVFGAIGSLLGVISVFLTGSGLLLGGAMIIARARLSGKGGARSGSDEK